MICKRRRIKKKFQQTSFVQGPLINSGFTTFVHLCWHWTSVRSFICFATIDQFSPYVSTKFFNAISYKRKSLRVLPTFSPSPAKRNSCILKQNSHLVFSPSCSTPLPNITIFITKGPVRIFGHFLIVCRITLVLILGKRTTAKKSS